jgi:hypothetical protein
MFVATSIVSGGLRQRRRVVIVIAGKEKVPLRRGRSHSIMSARGALMPFMLAFFADEAGWRSLNVGDRQAAVEKIGAWYERQAGSGVLRGGGKLQELGVGATVYLDQRGQAALRTSGKVRGTKDVSP